MSLFKKIKTVWEPKSKSDFTLSAEMIKKLTTDDNEWMKQFMGDFPKGPRITAEAHDEKGFREIQIRTSRGVFQINKDIAWDSMIQILNENPDITDMMSKQIPKIRVYLKTIEENPRTQAHIKNVFVQSSNRVLESKRLRGLEPERVFIDEETPYNQMSDAEIEYLMDMGEPPKEPNPILKAIAEL